MNRCTRICSPLHEPLCQPANSKYQRQRGELYIYIKNFVRQHLFFILCIFLFVHYLFFDYPSCKVLITWESKGISIRANRYKGIRAALLYSDEVAEMAKKHNNANILVFGGRTMSQDDVAKRIRLFLTTEFEGGRHQKRIDLLDAAL